MVGVTGHSLLAFVAVSPVVIWFNARYTLLFLLPLWILAARGILTIGRRLSGSSAYTWYAVVLLLLLPKVLSHYQDGSRRDYRSAASIIAPRIHTGEVVYCNWPQNLGYYFPDGDVRQWHDDSPMPDDAFYVVEGTNAWTPTLFVPGRVVEHIAKIGRRRFDEQSNLVQVYRVESSLNHSKAKVASPSNSDTSTDRGPTPVDDH